MDGLEGRPGVRGAHGEPRPGIGLVTGLVLVNVLGLLGMDVQTGTGELLHRVFGG